MPTVPDHAPLCAAADASPRAPATALPPLTCDTHAHVCGPAEKFPYAAERIYTPPDAPLGAYRALLKALGVERAVLVQPSVYGTDNTAMLAALRETGAGLRGVAVIEPTLSKAEIADMHAAGVRGVRLNVVDRRDGKNLVPTELVAKLVELIAEHGWHLEFLVNFDEAEGFAEQVKGLPVDIVLGHLGYPKSGAAGWPEHPGFASLLRLIDGGRCWVKLTGPYRISAAADIPYEDLTRAAQKLAAAAPERLVWGTDWPHVMMKKRMPNDGELADLLHLWVPDTAARARILVDNPAALYGFAAGERLPE